MNDVTPVFDRDNSQPLAPDVRHTAEPPPRGALASRRGGWLVALGASAILVAALVVGAQRHAAAQHALAATAEQQRTFVPSLRVATVKAGDRTMLVTLPATTAAFASANIFARASGYISRRSVDIGDQVTAGQVLAEITAPELDHQIAQANATLSQDQAALQQAKANKDLARVTNERDSPLVKEGWVTPQQGDTDRLTLRAQKAAVGVAQANMSAQQAQLGVLNQQKAYQSVVAPFAGVITQRNVDVGSLVQADATSGTFMFTIMQSNVIRIQVYVPQDAAFGLAPGVEAVVHVPEIAERVFRGTVTRIADALQPGTRTLLTEIDIPNPDGALAPGIYCTVELHIPQRTPLLTIPADALVFGPEGLQVAVLAQGRARMHHVVVTRDLGTEVEVQDGVRAGDQVILNPPVDLADGSPVRAQPEPAAATGES